MVTASGAKEALKAAGAPDPAEPTGPGAAADVPHIGDDAAWTLVQFVEHLVLKICERTRHWFEWENRKLFDAGKTRIRRIRAWHVRRAISDVLNDPDRYLPGWRKPPFDPNGG